MLSTTIITVILLMFSPIQSCDIVNEYNITIEANESESSIAYNNPFDQYFYNLSTSIVRSNRTDEWDCIDYSIDFVKNNPDWRLVTISPDKNFKRHVHGDKIHQGSHLLCYNFYNTQFKLKQFKLKQWRRYNKGSSFS